MTLILQGTDNSVSSPAVQGGTAGTTTGVYYPASNQIALATNGTLGLIQDSAQNIGVGAAPAGWSGGTFNVIQGTGGGTLAFRPNASNVDFLSNAYYNGTNFIYQKTGYPALRYRIEDGGTFNWFTAPIGTAGNTVTFTAALALGVGTTLALQGASSQTGTGITFPATQSASSDANTLDDYEEGTWTPATAPSTSGTVTLKNISAYYTKVGRVVNVWFTAQVNTVSSPNGRLGLSGLPFAANTSPIGAITLINGFSAFSGSTGALIESGTTANMDIYVNGSIASNLANYAAANAYIFFNATYTT